MLLVSLDTRIQVDLQYSVINPRIRELNKNTFYDISVLFRGFTWKIMNWIIQGSGSHRILVLHALTLCSNAYADIWICYSGNIWINFETPAIFVSSMIKIAIWQFTDSHHSVACLLFHKEHHYITCRKQWDIKFWNIA